MNKDFWLARWSKHEIGFHQKTVNPYLETFWPQLRVPVDATAFVPLCGKSMDMHWLRAHGHPVLGIEISRGAIEEFFAEAGLSPTATPHGAFERFAANGITLLCGDFFELSREDVREVRGVFDRASLNALPPELRARYAEKMRQILPKDAVTLLITTDYDQAQMSGPPFAVADAEVQSLYGNDRVESFVTYDVTESPDNARFKQRGLTRFVERVYRISV